MGATAHRIAAATLVAGTLDILSACVYSVAAGGTPIRMLQGVASAVLPRAKDAGFGGAAAGLALHFAIMTVMATVYVLAAQRIAILKSRWLAAGISYGLATWAVMNLVVLPLRWPALFPHVTATGLSEQLFSHIALVGIPIAWIARR